jgi:hypothetical protein
MLQGAHRKGCGGAWAKDQSSRVGVCVCGVTAGPWRPMSLAGGTVCQGKVLVFILRAQEEQ